MPGSQRNNPVFTSQRRVKAEIKPSHSRLHSSLSYLRFIYIPLAINNLGLITLQSPREHLTKLYTTPLKKYQTTAFSRVQLYRK